MSRRGRPKAVREERDTGTPELCRKRAEGITTEPLDWCLARGTIDERQHWCGIHLRWLYTLRHGAPGVRALDLNHVTGLEAEQDDPRWRELREAEYHEAMRHLQRYGYARALINLCVLSEPASLHDVSTLRDGLELLVKWWGR